MLQQKNLKDLTQKHFKLVQKTEGIAANMQTKPNLKNIVELTEENQQNQQHQIQSNQSSSSAGAKICQFIVRFGYYCAQMIKKKMIKDNVQSIQIQDTNIHKALAMIKAKSHKLNKVLPVQDFHKKVLVLDLDETLIHTSYTVPPRHDLEVDFLVNGAVTKAYVIKRYGLDSFLFEMSQFYEIIVYSQNHRNYLAKILPLIDPKQRISHYLHSQHCVLLNGNKQIKNIQILNRKIKEVILVDDSSLSGLLHPDNFYKISPFTGNQKDRELIRLSAFLKNLLPLNSVIPVRRYRQQFQQMEINLTEESSSINAFLSPQLNRQKHQRRHSETDTLATLSIKTEETDSTTFSSKQTSQFE